MLLGYITSSSKLNRFQQKELKTELKFYAAMAFVSLLCSRRLGSSRNSANWLGGALRGIPKWWLGRRKTSLSSLKILPLNQFQTSLRCRYSNWTIVGDTNHLVDCGLSIIYARETGQRPVETGIPEEKWATFYDQTGSTKWNGYCHFFVGNLWHPTILPSARFRYIRKFWRRRRRGRRLVKNEFIFYLRMSQQCKSVQCTYRSKPASTTQAKPAPTTFNSKKRYKI